MTNQRYDATFKAQAVELVLRKTRPPSVIAAELGVPRKTLHRWLELARPHPAGPFVGSGPLRPDDPRRRDREREHRDLREEHAILTTALRVVTPEGTYDGG